MSDKDKIDGVEGAKASSPANSPASPESQKSLPVEQKPASDAPAGKGGAAKTIDKTRDKASRRRWRRLLSWLLVLLIVAGLGAAAYFLYQDQLQQQEQREQEAAARINALRDQLAASQEQLSSLVQGQQQLHQRQLELERQLVTRVDDIEQRLSHHGSRLRALSTTSREDWLLAEAEYLLKLANQRLLIERSTDAAEGLLEQADKILRDMADPQLTAIRRAIARDLTELKLATRIDLEGLYLRLASLAESVPQLPVVPTRKPEEDKVKEDRAAAESASTESQWWQKPLVGLRSMLNDLDDYVRIRDHAQTPAALLPPDAAQYLQQNLRMMLERSQLAAMREEAQVYRRSLENVVDWARRFYPSSQQRDNFIAEVEELAGLDVDQELPDISESLQMLKNYIDRLHKLDGVEVESQVGGQVEGQDAGADTEGGEQTEPQP